ncbi:hypothetical protein TIFTF001_005795 [Ficus carica]|uniref:Uncharacterized protein n=1 Tax=Ficus carica TaxID=3494 RepID=A0AA87ZZ26_FICCA|nr:hypothetical protein TIFTF001_005795 [Ficus carica]
MLQFSKRLISKGLKVTLVTAFINVETVQARGGEIGIETISDITEVDRDVRSVDAFLKGFHQLVSLKLPQVVEKQKNMGNPVRYLVFDSIAPWALDFAKQLGLAAAPFFTQSCAVNVIFYNVHRGLLRIPVEGSGAPCVHGGVASARAI